MTDIGGGAIGCKTKEGGGAFRPDFLSGGEVSAVPELASTPTSTGGSFRGEEDRIGVLEEVCMTARVANNTHGPDVSTSSPRSRHCPRLLPELYPCCTYRYNIIEGNTHL